MSFGVRDGGSTRETKTTWDQNVEGRFRGVPIDHNPPSQETGTTTLLVGKGHEETTTEETHGTRLVGPVEGMGDGWDPTESCPG